MLLECVLKTVDYLLQFINSKTMAMVSFLLPGTILTTGYIPLGVVYVIYFSMVCLADLYLSMVCLSDLYLSMTDLYVTKLALT